MDDSPLHGLDPRDLFREGFSALRGAGIPWEPPAVETLATEFERYEILRLAGRGGMGAVYVARHRKLGKRVAVKLLPPECGMDAEAARRFQAEGALLASLHHPAVVSVFDSGETAGGSPFFVMEYVEGEDLAACMKRGLLPQQEAAAIIEAVAGALTAAHAQGVLHRDLKPSNVLLGADGRVRVADFGLAMVIGAVGDPLDEDSSPGLGTEAYAAPEQLAGTAPPAPAVDVYSLGVLSYELLTGGLPPGDLSAPLRRAGVDSHFDAPLLRALQFDPAHRTASAAAFLREWRDASTARERETNTRRRLRLTRRVAGAMAVLVAVASGMALVLWQRGQTIARQRGDLVRLEKSARQEAADTEISLANRNAADGPASWPVAIAHLARALRLNPGDPSYAQRMYSLLATYGWPEPVGNALPHNGPLRYAVFSPDGKSVATASDDGTARLWDAVTTEPRGSPMKHGKGVARVDFSPDGKWLATASDDGTARVWDAATGAPVSPPLAHCSRVLSARFDPDSRRLVTASEDNTGQVWDAMTGQRIGPALQHGDDVTSAVFSPDGRRVLTTSTDCTIRLSEMPQGELVLPFPTGVHWMLAGEFSQDGSLIVLTLIGGITQLLHLNPNGSWNTVVDLRREGESPPRLEGLPVPSVISPDRLWVAAVVGAPGIAGVWELHSAKPIFHSDVWRHRRKLTSLAFSGDSRHLLTASLDGTAVLWDIKSNAAYCLPMRHPQEVNHAALAPAGTRVVTASSDGTGRIWAPHPAAVKPHRLPSPPAATEVWGVAASPDGHQLATGSNAGDVLLWDANSLKPEGSWNTGIHVFNVDFSPDSKLLLTTRRYTDVQIWDIRTQTPVRTLEYPGYRPRTARFSPDGRYVAAGGDPAAMVWDVLAEASAPPLILRQPDDVHSVAWMPDSRRLVTTCGDGLVQMWDVSTGAALPFSVLLPNDALSCDVSPDGNWIATGSLDGTARVWNAASGRPVSEPMVHAGRVAGVRFSPEGARLVTASDTGAIVVWEALTGHILHDPLDHPSEAYGAVFTMDGRHLLSASRTSAAMVWDLGPDPHTPAPAWLPDAAEKLGGLMLDEEGRLVNSPGGWRELAGERLQGDSPEPFARLFRDILSPAAR